MNDDYTAGHESLLDLLPFALLFLLTSSFPPFFISKTLFSDLQMEKQFLDP